MFLTTLTIGDAALIISSLGVFYTVWKGTRDLKKVRQDEHDEKIKEDVQRDTFSKDLLKQLEGIKEALVKKEDVDVKQSLQIAATDTKLTAHIENTKERFDNHDRRLEKIETHIVS